MVPLIATLGWVLTSPRFIGSWAMLIVQAAVLAGLATGTPIPGRRGWFITAAVGTLAVCRH
ncbi:MAG: hypothetical protein ACR2P2_01020 [Nakamurella sp.]